MDFLPSFLFFSAPGKRDCQAAQRGTGKNEELVRILPLFLFPFLFFFEIDKAVSVCVALSCGSCGRLGRTERSSVT